MSIVRLAVTPAANAMSWEAYVSTTPVRVRSKSLSVVECARFWELSPTVVDVVLPAQMDSAASTTNVIVRLVFANHSSSTMA